MPETRKSNAELMKENLAKRDKEVRKEKKRLLKIFEDIDENKMEFVMHLIDDLAWLNVSEKELEENINKMGTVTKYNHGGGQSGWKENPNVKTLIAYQKNIATITKQLIDLVPAKKKSRLQEFLNDE